MVELFRTFYRTRQASSVVEFALLVPLFLVLLLGSMEFNRYFRYARHLELSVDMVAHMMSQRNSPIGPTDLNFDLNASEFVFRELASEEPVSVAWWRKLGHQITHVVFTPTVAGCTTSCTYEANVAWSWPDYKIKLGSLSRACGKLQPAGDGVAPNGSTLPAKMFGPGSLIVVDLTFDYKPVFGAGLVPPFRMVRQAYYAPRFATPYLPALNGPSITRCPGF